MTLDNELLEQSKSWTHVQLGLDTSLIDDYITTTGIYRKRELTLKFFDSINKKYFFKFENSNNFLIGLKKFEEDLLYKYLYYRDHFIHLFQVFLLGCYIIESACDGGYPLGKLYDINPERFIRTWFLISFYHDIGYLAEKLIIIGKEIQKIYFDTISGLNLTEFEIKISKSLDQIFKDYLKIITEGILIGETNKFIFDKKLNSTPKLNIVLNELLEKYKRRDHGIMSALFLYYTFYMDIDFIEKEVIANEYLQDLNIACCAIAIHSLEKSEKIHIDFENNDLGCLLILCDNIQEWNRPRMENLKFFEFDIWESLEITVNPTSKTFFFNFKLNDKYPQEAVIKLLTFLFKELKRIFYTTFIEGPNFTFLFKDTSIEHSLTAKYDDSKKSYIITKTLT